MPQTKAFDGKTHTGDIMWGKGAEGRGARQGASWDDHTNLHGADVDLCRLKHLEKLLSAKNK
jgi:hypothetical protein